MSQCDILCEYYTYIYYLTSPYVDRDPKPNSTMHHLFVLYLNEMIVKTSNTI